MTYVLIRTLACLVIMAAVFIGLVVLASISPRERSRVTRVLMFSSRDEADRAAAVAADHEDHGVVVWPQYVPDIHRYFVVIEEVRAGPDCDQVRRKTPRARTSAS